MNLRISTAVVKTEAMAEDEIPMSMVASDEELANDWQNKMADIW